MNLLDSYETYFKRFWPFLRHMSQRGIPIDEKKRKELGEFIDQEILQVTKEVQPLVPPEVLSTKQKNGFKNPPILECEECGWKGRGDHICLSSMNSSEESVMLVVPYSELAEKHLLVLREVIIGEEEKCRCSKKKRGECAVCAGSGIIPVGLKEMRWATPIQFNPNSWIQVRRLIRFLKHPVPKHIKRVDQNGEAADTTEMKELERLFAKTNHPIYPLLVKRRMLSKMKGTYVEGYAPLSDGRVHSTYTFNTATWQTSSKSPNVQNSPERGKTSFQKLLVQKFKEMMTSSDDQHLLINFDYKSFHAQTTACEAGLPDYLRLAKIDIHSFVACHFIKHPQRNDLLSWSDSDLKRFFKEERMNPREWTNHLTFEEIRNGKTKSAGLGIGFGMGPRKLYMLYKEDFASLKEAEVIHSLITKELFPGLGKWQNNIRDKAHEDGVLIGRGGGIRHFYDVKRFDRKQQRWVPGEQSEQAIAFLPANNAFMMIRSAAIEIEERGLAEKYEAINSTHDSFKFNCPIDLVEEAKVVVAGIMTRPNSLMVYPGVTGPEGLSVEVESHVGKNMKEMH